MRAGMIATEPPASAEIPQDFSAFMASFGEAAEQAVQAERRYLELVVSERAGRIGSGIALMVIILFLSLVAVLLAVFAAAKAWGDKLGSEALGYLATSGVCAGVVMLFLLFGSPLRCIIKLRIINALTDND